MVFIIIVVCTYSQTGLPFPLGFCQSEQVLISGQIRSGMAALLVILCCRIKIAEKNVAFSRKISAFHPEKQPFRDLIILKRL